MGFILYRTVLLVRQTGYIIGLWLKTDNSLHLSLEVLIVTLRDWPPMKAKVIALLYN